MKMKTYGRMRRIWRIWAKSLGEKVGETDKQADTVAVILAWQLYLTQQQITGGDYLVYLRVLLLIWLAFSVKADDDLYGVRYSMNALLECKKVKHETQTESNDGKENSISN